MIDRIAAKARDGDRLDDAEARFMLSDAPLLDLGHLAAEIRHQRYPGDVVTYVAVSYTHLTLPTILHV